MSLELPIVVYGNGVIFQHCFVSLTHVFGDSVFTTIFRMAILLGGVAAIFSAITQRDFMQCVKWFGRYYLVYCVLFSPKLNVYIDDRFAEQKFNVDGFPLGLAIFTSYATTIGDALTRLVEKNLNFAERFSELNYSRGGMMLASRMLLSMSQWQAPLQFGANLQSFIKNCSQAAPDEILNSADLWHTIMSKVSRAGTFTYNGMITACVNEVGDKGGQLNVDLKAAVDQAQEKYSKFLFPWASDPQAAFKHALFSSYTYLFDVASDLGQMEQITRMVMQQTLLLNIIQTEIVNLPLLKPLASFGYKIVWWLPLAKNFIEIIVYASFMFVVLLALFPQGTAILKQYVLLLLWLQLWPPLYVMVNYICSVCAKSYMLGANLSLQFLSKLLQVNSDVIALAGYLSLITSVLTAILMSGIVTMFVQWFKQEVTLTNAAATVEAPPTGLNNNVSMFSSQNHQL